MKRKLLGSIEKESHLLKQFWFYWSSHKSLIRLLASQINLKVSGKSYLTLSILQTKFNWERREKLILPEAQAFL